MTVITTEEVQGYLEVLNIADHVSHIELSDDGPTDQFNLAHLPLFSLSVKNACKNDNGGPRQYAVLCHELDERETAIDAPRADPIFLNTDAPWSAFICGSQGAGKSHTLSCVLENCLLPSAKLGRLTHPPSGILFHYDVHVSDVPCEAAHLAPAIPTTVLVSPSNFWQRKRIYQNLNPQIQVLPLLLREHHLNIQRMHRLMAVKESGGTMPLYMELITVILRHMAIKHKDLSGLDYKAFVRCVEEEKRLTKDQRGPLNMRMDLLESFMAHAYSSKKTFGLSTKGDPFAVQPGTLTIVDLSDNLIDAPSACSLFDIALALFFESPSTGSKLVALDEAHKFMTDASSDDAFTESLLQLVREQRHKGARIVISTQEPTVSPKLLDLCSMTFIHRFSSPAWLETLRKHLAGAADPQLMEKIARLKVGESILFAPLAALHLEGCQMTTLGTGHVRLMTRKRLTSDGGQSLMASNS